MKEPKIDPIVEEIRKEREEYAAKFDFDLEKIFLDLKRLEQEDDGPYVSFSREEGTEPSEPHRRRSSRS